MPVSKKRPRTVLTPGDLGDSRTRNAYKKSGPCIVYNIKGVNAVTDRTLKTLVAMNFDRAREAGLEICKEMSDSQLKQFWSVPLSYVRRMRYLLGIEKDRRGTIYVRNGHPDQWPPVFRKDDIPARDRSATMQPGAVTTRPQTAEPGPWNTDGPPGMSPFSLSFNGIFNADDLKSRIEAVKALLGGSPESKYAIDVTLKEIGNGSKTGHKSAEALSGRGLLASEVRGRKSEAGKN